MNDFIKNKIKWKHQIYNTCIKNGRKNSDYVNFQEATSIVSEVTIRRKEECQNHIALMLSDLMSGT